MEGFTTLSYLLSFTGMVTAVIFLTNVTKKLFDRLFNNRTMYVVAGWSGFFSLLAFIYLGNWEDWKTILESLVVWLVNSAIVWVFAMKAFEMTGGKPVDGTLLIDKSDPAKDTYRFDMNAELEQLGNKKTVTLKVDKNADLSQD